MFVCLVCCGTYIDVLSVSMRYSIIFCIWPLAGSLTGEMGKKILLLSAHKETGRHYKSQGVHTARKIKKVDSGKVIYCQYIYTSYNITQYNI